jgi:quercetin dioxygenase-like cupin family protein
MQPGNIVRRVSDSGVVESPDHGMRDSVLIDDKCGAKDFTAGLVWVAPHSTIHEDAHPFDEAYYVVRGTAEVILSGEIFNVKAGDVVFLPAEARHRVHNPTAEVFEIFWCIGGPMSALPGVPEELAKWPAVDADSGWHRVLSPLEASK